MINKRCTDLINGVYYSRSKSKYVSTITIDKKRRSLGLYADYFDACCARKSAEAKYNIETSINFDKSSGADLRRILDYDEGTGIFTWKIHTGNKSIGDVAGRLLGNGYVVIGISGKEYLAHRLVWLYVYDVWPDYIDHENHVRNDNRLVNLRNVEQSENSKNLSKAKNNTSGITGVSYIKRDGIFRASINYNKQAINLGSFDCLLDACSARKSAENRLGFHENHGTSSDQLY